MVIRSVRACLLLITSTVLLVSGAFADGSDIDAQTAAGETAQQHSAEGRHYTQPRPPGSVSEDGDMKVWDTRGPVEVSPHLPSTAVDSGVDSFNQNQVSASGVGGPAGIVVDARQRGGIYPGADPRSKGR